jgi:hypothetical protein
MIGRTGLGGYRSAGVSDMLGGSIFIWQYTEGYPVYANRVYSNGWVVHDTTGIDRDDEQLPEAISMSNYPNPFNSSTLLTIKGINKAEITIFDITGRRVATLHAENGQVLWNAEGHSSGVYFARVKEPNWAAQIVKMVLLK